MLLPNCDLVNLLSKRLSGKLKSCFRAINLWSVCGHENAIYTALERLVRKGEERRLYLRDLKVFSRRCP